MVLIPLILSLHLELKVLNLLMTFPSSKLKSKSRNKKFDIITSIAMFYDLEDPSSFVKSINNFLSKDDLWIFEVSYIPKMLN